MVDLVVHRCRRWLSAVPAIEQDPAELPKTQLPIFSKDPAANYSSSQNLNGPVCLCGRIVLIEWYSLYLPVGAEESLESFSNVASKRQGVCHVSISPNQQHIQYEVGSGCVKYVDHKDIQLDQEILSLM